MNSRRKNGSGAGQKNRNFSLRESFSSSKALKRFRMLNPLTVLLHALCLLTVLLWFAMMQIPQSTEKLNWQVFAF